MAFLQVVDFVVVVVFLGRQTFLASQRDRFGNSKRSETLANGSTFNKTSAVWSMSITSLLKKINNKRLRLCDHMITVFSIAFSIYKIAISISNVHFSLEGEKG